jgi:hypothetical protein
VDIPALIFGDGAEYLRGGQILLNASLNTAEAAGYPLHVLKGEREVLRSFGSETAELRRRCLACLMRVLAVAPDSTSAWVALPDQYVLERWTIAGRLAERITIVRSPWYPAFGDEARTSMSLPLTPVRSLRADPDGLLWIRSNIPDSLDMVIATYRGGPRPMPRRVRKGSVLEVVDTRTGQLIASREFPTLLIHVGGSDMTYSTRESADGVISIDIWRLRLRRPN